MQQKSSEPPDAAGGLFTFGWSCFCRSFSAEAVAAAAAMAMAAALACCSIDFALRNDIISAAEIAAGNGG